VWQLKLRGWHIIVGLIAVALAVLGIALYFTRSPKLDAAGMAAYFPAREAVVVYIDVARMRASGVLDKLVGSTVGEEQEYRTFVRNTGFDYKRDLDAMMLNSASGIHYFVLKGRFDWDKLRDYARSQGGKCEGAHCSLKGSTPDRVISYRRLGDDALAMASARDEEAAKAIDRRTPEKLPFEIPGSPVWAHVPSEAIRALPQYPSGTRLFAKAIESAERAVFTLGPEQDHFELAVNVSCRNQEDAATLKAQLEGITSLLQKLITREKQSPNSADLSGVLSSGAFERNGTNVRGRWPISRAFIDALGRS
jgi:hypothetical protein